MALSLALISRAEMTRTSEPPQRSVKVMCNLLPASARPRCMDAFADRDLVFFDPDNGLEVKSATGRKRSKYVLLDEVADHYGAGRLVLFYQHLGKSLPAKAFVEEKAAKLRAVLACASMSAFDTPHVVFLLAAGTEHASNKLRTCQFDPELPFVIGPVNQREA
jgi:hypothetical protein